MNLPNQNSNNLNNNNYNNQNTLANTLEPLNSQDLATRRDSNTNNLNNLSLKTQRLETNNFRQNQTVKTQIKSGKNNFFRNFFIILFLILSLSLASLIYLLAKPNDPVNKFIIKNTALNKVIKIEEDSDNKNSEVRAIASLNSQDNENLENQVKVKNDLTDNKKQKSFEFAPSLDSKTTVEIVEENLPSVLSISVRSNENLRGLSRAETAGTGYIVSEDGLVVTNKHVISPKCRDSSARIEITALSHDQKAYQLELLSVDPIDDIAILKIQNSTKKFKAVSFADTTKLKLGQDVLAIGNVLGQLQNTVTRGIISGLERTLQTDLIDECTGTKIAPDGLIQTDAAINKGNSGGPLFDFSGNLVGMNTFGTTEAQNVGLAIPANTIVSALNSFKKNNKIVRPRLGVTTLPLDPLKKAQYTWLPVDYGEIIYNDQGESVSPNSSAFKAGIREGDIILEVDDQKIISNDQNTSPLRRVILTKQAGDKIKLKVLKTKESSNINRFFEYESEPKILEVELGGVSFDLPKLSIFK